MGDPIARVQNPYPKNIVEFVKSLPKEKMSYEKFKSYMDNCKWGGDAFFKTYYQLCCQVGLYYIDEKKFFHPRFHKDISEIEAEEYLIRWFSRYYIPNPYTKGFQNLDKPIVVDYTIYECLRNSEKKSIEDVFFEVFREKIGNPDILINAINNFSKLVKVENGNCYIKGDLINMVVDNSRDDKKAFFDTFNETSITDDEGLKTLMEKASSYINPEQIIFYGVPGSGKSHTIKEKLKNEYNITEGNEDLQVMRTVFHPEYTNADFIGQILPRITEGKTEFEFKPGPFTKILKRAMCDPLKRYVLVVEEINRGNAAAIFGDLFQLLDRIEDEEEKTSYDGGVNHFGKGWSDYFVMNSEINNFIRDSRDDFDGKAVNISGIHFSANTGIRLPPNLSILATMNTSDQNVFTLDNAFQRRFEKILIRNEFYVTNITDENLKKQIENQRDANIETTNCTWGTFQVKINERISETAQEMGLSSMEDKRLGCWFVKNKNGIITKEQFAGNVLKYLWDDAFKFNRSSIFSEEFNNFEELSKAFLVENKELSIFTIPFNEE